MTEQENKNRILFVDDEKRILNGLKRLLYHENDRWELEFVTSGREALKRMQEKRMDLVVTDIHMPDIDGIDLLRKIKRDHPTVLRIGLSGTADKNLNLSALHLVHQYLPKPCKKETIVSTLERSLALKNIMEADRVKEIISQINTLPSLPSMYYEIIDKVNSEKSSIREIGKIVSRDISMSTKVLQLINSAYFGLRNEVTDPIKACVYLGLDNIKSLVLTVKIFDKFKESDVNQYYIDTLWNHGLKVAKCSQKIAQENNMSPDEIKNFWTAGLLHDIGKLVIAVNFPHEFQKIRAMVADDHSLLAAENRILGSNHGEIGAYLMGLWGLPTPLISTCAFHHYPEKYSAKNINPVNVIHFANAMVHQNGQSGQMLARKGELNQEYFQKLGIDHHLERWEKLCQESSVSEDEIQ